MHVCVSPRVIISSISSLARLGVCARVRVCVHVCIDVEVIVSGECVRGMRIAFVVVHNDLSAKIVCELCTFVLACAH